MLLDHCESDERICNNIWLVARLGTRLKTSDVVAVIGGHVRVWYLLIVTDLRTALYALSFFQYKQITVYFIGRNRIIVETLIFFMKFKFANFFYTLYNMIQCALHIQVVSHGLHTRVFPANYIWTQDVCSRLVLPLHHAGISSRSALPNLRE